MELRHSILTARKQARSMHLESLAQRVAVGDWASKDDLKAAVNRAAIQKLPRVFKHGSIELDATNNHLISQSVGDAYGALALDEADNEVNIRSLEAMKEELQENNLLETETIGFSTCLDSLLKTPHGKVPDPQGVVGECLLHLPYQAKVQLHETFNNRCQVKNWEDQGSPNDVNTEGWHDNWKYVDCVLVPKSSGYQTVVDVF